MQCVWLENKLFECWIQNLPCVWPWARYFVPPAPDEPSSSVLGDVITQILLGLSDTFYVKGLAWYQFPNECVTNRSPLSCSCPSFYLSCIVLDTCLDYLQYNIRANYPRVKCNWAMKYKQYAYFWTGGDNSLFSIWEIVFYKKCLIQYTFSGLHWNSDSLLNILYAKHNWFLFLSALYLEFTWSKRNLIFFSFVHLFIYLFI